MKKILAAILLVTSSTAFSQITTTNADTVNAKKAIKLGAVKITAFQKDTTLRDTTKVPTSKAVKDFVEARIISIPSIYLKNGGDLGDSMFVKINDSTYQWKNIILGKGLSLILTDSTFKISLVPANGTISSASTITPDVGTQEIFTVTALATDATFAAPTGTALNGQQLIIRIKDNGTSHALTWNSIYRASIDFALPATTVAGKTMYIQFIYNTADSKYDATGLTQGF